MTATSIAANESGGENEVGTGSGNLAWRWVPCAEKGPHDRLGIVAEQVEIGRSRAGGVGEGIDVEDSAVAGPGFFRNLAGGFVADRAFAEDDGDFVFAVWVEAPCDGQYGKATRSKGQVPGSIRTETQIRARSSRGRSGRRGRRGRGR